MSKLPLTAKESAWQRLAEARRPLLPGGVIQCPRCNGLTVKKSSRRPKTEFVCESQNCKEHHTRESQRRFTVTTGTILERKKSLQRYLQSADYIFQHKYQPTPSRKLGNAIGTSSGSTNQPYRDMVYRSMIPPIAAPRESRILNKSAITPMHFIFSVGRAFSSFVSHTWYDRLELGEVFVLLEVEPAPSNRHVIKTTVKAMNPFAYITKKIRLIYYTHDIVPDNLSTILSMYFITNTPGYLFHNFTKLDIDKSFPKSTVITPKDITSTTYQNSILYKNIKLCIEHELEEFESQLRSKKKNTPIGQFLCEYMFYRNFEFSHSRQPVTPQDLYACLVEPRPYDDPKRKQPVPLGHGF